MVINNNSGAQCDDDPLICFTKPSTTRVDRD